MGDKRANRGTIGGDVRDDTARASHTPSRKKICVHCGEKLGFHAFVEFLKDGYSDDIHCDSCYGVNNLERSALNGVDAGAGLIAIAAFIGFALLPSIAYAVATLDSFGGFRITAWAIAGGIALGFTAAKLCLSLRKWQAASLERPIDKTQMREHG